MEKLDNNDQLAVGHSYTLRCPCRLMPGPTFKEVTPGQKIELLPPGTKVAIVSVRTHGPDTGDPLPAPFYEVAVTGRKLDGWINGVALASPNGLMVSED